MDLNASRIMEINDTVMIHHCLASHGENRQQNSVSLEAEVHMLSHTQRE